MDYFTQIGDEANLTSKYSEQLNAINNQKNLIAEQGAQLATEKATELYNYGLDKFQNIKSDIDAGLELGGLGGAKVAKALYSGSGLQASVNQGISDLKTSAKDWYNSTADDVLGKITPQTAPEQEGIELDTFKSSAQAEPTATAEATPATAEPTAEAPPVEAESIAEQAPAERSVEFENPTFDPAPLDTGSGSVEGVTASTLEDVQTQDEAANAFNATIQSDVSSGELSARPPSETETTEPDVETPAEASAGEADLSSGLGDAADIGAAEAKSTVSSVLKTGGDVAEGAGDIAEGLGGQIAAESTLDFSGLGEVLTVGSILETGVKSFIDWIDPPPKPPPPVAPQLQAIPQAPTFISAQVQSGV